MLPQGVRFCLLGQITPFRMSNALSISNAVSIAAATALSNIADVTAA